MLNIVIDDQVDIVLMLQIIDDDEVDDHIESRQNVIVLKGYDEIESNEYLY